MARNYAEIIPDAEGIVLNLGPGSKHIDGAIELEYPDWDAEKDNIPLMTDSVDMIHAYHILEHVRNIPFLIKEINRVLKPGGHVNIVVPYYSSQLQAQDLDHKTSFTEKSFSTLFQTSYYSKGKAEPMKIATNFIMGDCEKNLCLVIQLVKL